MKYLVIFLVTFSVVSAVLGSIRELNSSNNTIESSYDIHVNQYDNTVIVYGKIDTHKEVGPVNIRAIQFMDKQSYKTVLMNEEYSAEVSNVGPWQINSYGDRLRLVYFDDRLNLMFTDWILFKITP